MLAFYYPQSQELIENGIDLWSNDFDMRANHCHCNARLSAELQTVVN
jgi:hypothetical protein